MLVTRHFRRQVSLAMLLLSCAAAGQERVDAPAVDPAVPVVVRPLPLSDVRLTGGPLKHAQDLNHDYLLQLEPDRMLAFLRMRAGLEPKAEPYGGWDGEGRQLTGHIAGHHLSAISHMYAATGDERLRGRAEYMVRELKEIQEAHGDGYIGAQMGSAIRTRSGGGGGGGVGGTTTRGEPQLIDGKALFEQVAKG